jgi:hypothetical protein
MSILDRFNDCFRPGAVIGIGNLNAIAHQLRGDHSYFLTSGWKLEKHTILRNYCVLG